jgi:hypothetical protein
LEKEPKSNVENVKTKLSKAICFAIAIFVNNPKDIAKSALEGEKS